MRLCSRRASLERRSLGISDSWYSKWMADAAGPVVVASFVSIGEAEIARSLIESEGIEVYLGNQHMVSMLWHYSHATGGVRLMVAAEHAERAREVLRTSVRPALELVHGAVDPVPDDAPGPGDALIEKAWKSTVIGFIGLPPALHLWALWLLRSAYAAGGPRTPRGRKLAGRTLVVSGSMVAIFGAFFVRVVVR